MNNNKNISDRQYAASIARKFFSGQISKRETLDSFPDFEKDFKLRQLHNRINSKPRKGLFGIDKDEYQTFLDETYELIEDIEISKFKIETMLRLFKELWLSSDNCRLPIENMSIRIKEVAHSTNNYKDDVRKYLLKLIDNNYLIMTSKEPLIFEFSETGKEIKSESDIKRIFKNDAQQEL